MQLRLGKDIEIGNSHDWSGCKVSRQRAERFPTWARDCFRLCSFQISSAAHLATSSVVVGGRRPLCEATTPTYSADFQNAWRHTSTPPSAFMASVLTVTFI